MSTTLDLRNAQRLFFGQHEAQQLYYGGQLLWTKPPANDGWVYPDFVPGLTSGQFACTVTKSADGSWSVIASSGATNPRAGFFVPTTGSFILETKLRYDTATRLIGRRVASMGAITGTQVFDINGTGNPAATIIRSDTIVGNPSFPVFHYVAVANSLAGFTILPECRWRPV